MKLNDFDTESWNWLYELFFYALDPDFSVHKIMFKKLPSLKY